MRPHRPAGRVEPRIIHNQDQPLGSRIWEAPGIPVTLRAPQLQRYREMEPSEIERLIEAGFERATVRVFSNDNTHFETLVVADEFEGRRPLARHQLVYKTLGALVGNEIHALSIRAFTPAEWTAESAEE